ncbi:MAG: hypothetical protein AAFZ65_01370 [Planctomycetota bacterium]
MKRHGRKTSPRVIGGKVQRKNNWTLTRDWSQTEVPGLAFARERPGVGHRHYLRKRDVERFVHLLPEWEQLSEGLDAVLLAEADGDVQGYHMTGVVAVCAWSKDLAEEWSRTFYEDHREVLERLDVEAEAVDADTVLVRFTEPAVVGFQLMHVLLHELGHHHDRMTTRSKRSAARGEGFAEDYALRHAEALWDAYFREFPW